MLKNCLYDDKEVQCFMRKKFLSGPVRRNSLKVKTSCKGNVKIRFICGSDSVLWLQAIFAYCVSSKDHRCLLQSLFFITLTLCILLCLEIWVVFCIARLSSAEQVASLVTLQQYCPLCGKESSCKKYSVGHVSWAIQLH
jgi:hypothetical protein